MFINHLAIRRLRLRVGHEACPAQSLLLARSQHEMIDPFKEVGGRLGPHAAGQLAGESIPLQEQSNAVAQELLGIVGQRPVKGLAGLGAGGGPRRRAPGSVSSRSVLVEPSISDLWLKIIQQRWESTAGSVRGT